jgi:hypothetical protein
MGFFLGMMTLNGDSVDGHSPFCRCLVLRCGGGSCSLRREGAARPESGPACPEDLAGPYLGSGTSRSLRASSSTLTSLKVTTLTFLTNRAGRYISQTHASCIVTSK